MAENLIRNHNPVHPSILQILIQTISAPLYLHFLQFLFDMFIENKTKAQFPDA